MSYGIYDIRKTMAIQELRPAASSMETWHDCKARFQRSSYSFPISPLHTANLEKKDSHDPKVPKVLRKAGRLAIKHADPR